ncbi:flagella biosynthesis regulatory protein FliZ [Providencia rettgeri]|uniref:flagella biosynthesis regulatory protein FliZ n=1 Tax=Providencia rettgeri TaxID=587 RepID=UPI00205DCB40|nr:flagella biosynthesis regulatory protein FliZ [Providencia rettgeri]ELR5072775.1 flagella biosynthesis regulatory protein FliZ [Providencia stuartii]ELR5223012.1 flagella biosynthesis regulatory protein FliZ [Providencia rettgeri]MDX7323250.1 flagella biosynthesis regulatory protein FliZ [Providencia rettgeri]UPS64435.1 flagella biosynthesis regulatory protein FliZ [Providencia rettgeri]
MSASIVKKRPLSRYIKDFKHSQTHCAHCHKTLDRISLVFNDDILNKEAIADMTELVDEGTWGELQGKFTALCRFCSEIYCNSNTDYFDIMSFKQYLFLQTEMSHSTVREYVVRLRRLDELLSSSNFSMKEFTASKVQDELSEKMTDSAFSNYNIALRKYEQYLFWESEKRNN